MQVYLRSAKFKQLQVCTHFIQAELHAVAQAGHPSSQLWVARFLKYYETNGKKRRKKNILLNLNTWRLLNSF